MSRRPYPRTITGRRLQVLLIFLRYRRQRKYPSVRQVAAEMGISTTGLVNTHLLALQDLEYIERRCDEARPRCYRLTNKAVRMLDKVVKRSRRFRRPSERTMEWLTNLKNSRSE